MKLGPVIAVLLLGGCMMPIPPVSGAGAGDLDRVAAYLNGLKRFEAHFDQTGDFGPGGGLVWLDRPGNLRIDYQGARSRVLVIAGGRMRILDRASGALTTMPLSRTPLGILLDENIVLSGPASGQITVASMSHAAGSLRVTLKKTDHLAQGALTLDFSDRPLALLAVSVTDARGQILTMRLTGIDPAPALTPGLFAPPTPAS